MKDFTTIAESKVLNTPVNDLTQLIHLVSVIWELNPGIPHQFKIIKKIIINSVKYN